MPRLTEKDRGELRYWLKADRDEHLKKISMYLLAWGYDDLADSVIEIGTGPYSGFLPRVSAKRRVGVDPLIDEYRKAGIFIEDDGTEYHCMRFEDFETDEKFDAVLCSDTLDHGDLDFGYFIKLADLCKDGGRVYLHVHLRPKEKLNMIHDHQLFEVDLDKALKATGMKEVSRNIYQNDIDGKFCTAIMGVWCK